MSKAGRTAAGEVLSPADRTSFGQLEARLGGRIGLVVSGLGYGQVVQGDGEEADARPLGRCGRR